MASMYMGYHYDMPKRGNGYSIQLAGGGASLFIAEMTKKSAAEVQKQMILDGHSPEHITIEKNEK